MRNVENPSRRIKHPRLKTVSCYWRIRVDATMEEQTFWSWEECVTWAAKVKHTFGDWGMTFTAIEVTERECHIVRPRWGEKGIL